MTRNWASVNLDADVFHNDYTDAYRPYLRGELEFSDGGNRFMALCPFHDESDASLSVDVRTGLFNCFGCNKHGNFLEFYAEMNGCDTKEAYRRILEEHGFKLEPGQPVQEIKTNSLGFSSLKLDDYARNKHLPADWLKQECNLQTSRDHDGIYYVVIPYFDEEGNLIGKRKRYSTVGTNKKHPFIWRRGDHANLYGLWRRQEFLRAKPKRLILVEGESDTQTLWNLGFATFGVPGAGLFQGEWVRFLAGFDSIYIHQEPDEAGDKFTNNVLSRLGAGGFEGRTFVFKCSDVKSESVGVGGNKVVKGFKDPSALFIARGDEAKNIISELLDSANEVDFKLPTPDSKIDGLEIALRKPEGWDFSRNELLSISPKDGSATLISKTPIFLTKRLENIDTHDVKSEIVFFDKAGPKREVVVRSDLFQSKTLPELANRGCSVGSENAKAMAKFLLELEAANMDIIPQVPCTSQLGWQELPGGKTCFLPYGDGLDGKPGIVIDCDPTTRRSVNAYRQKGTVADWCKAIKPLREKSDILRFLIASSAAAPLLRILGLRSFSVYLWGESKAGKTAALKLAMSFWGDPDGLIKSFNTTKVGMEMLATLSRDLPLGIDERQLNNKKDLLSELIYMISEGQGRIRGAKNGGLRSVGQWLTIMLATGEEPLTSDYSMTGMTNRIIEIKGAPFVSEDEARIAHRLAATNYGAVAAAFIKILMATPRAWLRDAYLKMEEQLRRRLGKGANLAHVSYAAAVALADALMSLWLFDDERLPETSARLAIANMDERLSRMRNDHEIISNADGSYSIPTDEPKKIEAREEAAHNNHYDDVLYLLGFESCRDGWNPWDCAIEMGGKILQRQSEQSGDSYGEAGVQAMADFYWKEHAHFEHDDEPKPKVSFFNGGQDAIVKSEPPINYGWSAKDQETGELFVCFNKTSLVEYLTKLNLNPKKILTYAADHSLIATSRDVRTKRIQETVSAKHNGVVKRVVKFFVTRVTKDDDSVELVELAELPF